MGNNVVTLQPNKIQKPYTYFFFQIMFPSLIAVNQRKFNSIELHVIYRTSLSNLEESINLLAIREAAPPTSAHPTLR